MSKERPGPERKPSPAEQFGFTRQEQLFDRVSHARLLALLDDAATSVHRVEESHNNYGEFLFVTVSRPRQGRRLWATFFGCGYHEYRERWLVDEWFYYMGNPLPEDLQQDITREQAKARIQERQTDIRASAQQDTQTKRGQFFEALADMTDDDGALAELEDLGDLWDLLAGND